MDTEASLVIEVAVASHPEGAIFVLYYRTVNIRTLVLQLAFPHPCKELTDGGWVESPALMTPIKSAHDD